MRKHTKVTLLLVLSVTVLAGTAYLLLRPASPINPRTYRRIKEGMNRREVEAVIGLPAGDYRSPDAWPLGGSPPRRWTPGATSASTCTPRAPCRRWRDGADALAAGVLTAPVAGSTFNAAGQVAQMVERSD